MRKAILAVVIVFFALASTLLVSGIIGKIQKKNQVSGRISKMPDFSFMTLTDEAYNSSMIKEGPVLIIRFHPECEHCQYEISEIYKSNMPSLGVNILMVSSAPTNSIKSFFKSNNFSDSPSITVLIDTSYIFEDIFGNDVIPSTYLYDKELNLVKALHGEVKIETLQKYISQIE